MKLTPTETKPDAGAKFPVLMSYFYLRKLPDEKLRFWMEHPGVELLVDSGGFSALNVGEEIELEEYMDWLERWTGHPFGCFALDKLGDPKASQEYLARMTGRGLKPIPIHVRGDGQERMDELFELSDWVGLGGFRRPHRGWCKKDYVLQKMQWAKGRHVHWLGYTKASMLTTFRPYSCDSSNMSQGEQWGLFAIYEGRGKWSTAARYDRGGGKAGPWNKRRLSDPLRRALRETGWTVEQFRDAREWQRSTRTGKAYMLTELNAWSFTRYVRDLRRLLGTRYFMAISPTKGRALCEQINETAPDPSHIQEIPEWLEN